MDEPKEAGAIYSVASEIVQLPLVQPVKEANLRTPPPSRKPKTQPQRDTVTISSEALQLARENAGAEDE